MHIPIFSPDMTIHGLPKDLQTRLSDLVAKLVYVPRNSGNRREYRHRCEESHLNFIESAAYGMESDYLRRLSEAQTGEKKRELLAEQEIYRCKFVAETLALHEMYSTRKTHAKALAAELVELKKLLSDQKLYHPLVALFMELVVLVRQSEQVEPHSAFDHIYSAPDLSYKRPFDAVKRIFEAVKGAPCSVRDDHTSGIKIPYIEIADAKGPALVLLEALRAAESARQSCPSEVLHQATDFPAVRTTFIPRLEKAVNEHDFRSFERIKQELADAQAGFFAAGVYFEFYRGNLEAARERLAETLVPACNAIAANFRVTLSTPHDVATLKAVINCIAAHRTIAQIARESQRDAKLLKAFNSSPQDARKFVDTALVEVTPPPAVY